MRYSLVRSKENSEKYRINTYRSSHYPPGWDWAPNEKINREVGSPRPRIKIQTSVERMWPWHAGQRRRFQSASLVERAGNVSSGMLGEAVYKDVWYLRTGCSNAQGVSGWQGGCWVLGVDWCWPLHTAEAGYWKPHSLREPHTGKTTSSRRLLNEMSGNW